MVIIRSLLLIVEVLVSIMLIGLILLQKSKGGGLGVAFGGGGEGSMFGSRTGNVLTKATIILGVVFLVNTLFLGILFTRGVTAGPSAIDRELMREPVSEAPLVSPVDIIEAEPESPAVPAEVQEPAVEIEPAPVAEPEPMPAEPQE